MTDKEFIKTIQKHCGQTQQAYIKKDESKHKDVGFVTFQTASQVQEAIRKRLIKISKSETLILKPFTLRPKKRLNLDRLLQTMLPECENMIGNLPKEPPLSPLYQNYASTIEDYNAGRVDMIIDLLDIRNIQIDVSRVLQHPNLSQEIRNRLGHVQAITEEQRAEPQIPREDESNLLFEGNLRSNKTRAVDIL
jgi:hypothetical protein